MLTIRMIGAVLGTALFATPAGSALSGDSDQSERLEVWWGGIKAADVLWSSHNADTRYNGRLEIRAVGTIRWLTGLDVAADATGLRESRRLEPRGFKQVSTWRRSERDVEVSFNPRGPAQTLRNEKRSSDPNESEDTPDPPPPLPETLYGVIDPVTAILTLGRRTLSGETRFTLPVFDGRHRYDLVVESIGPGSHDINGNHYDTEDVKLVVHPLAGFKPAVQKLWEGVQFTIYLGRADGLPVKMESSSFAVSTVISVTARCPPVAQCGFSPRS